MYKKVAKIVGRSTYKTLKILQKQIKANAASVTSSLGGGFHGHLGLVISASEYNNISGCHFAKPIHPGKLTIPDGSALHDAIRLDEEHIQQLNHFHKILTVEYTLKSQIIGALDSTYIKELINSSTETILYRISKIFIFLFDPYGNIK